MHFTLSVCTGVFILDAARLIDAKRVTTHWEVYDELRSQTVGRSAEVIPYVLFTQDGGL